MLVAFKRLPGVMGPGLRQDDAGEAFEPSNNVLRHCEGDDPPLDGLSAKSQATREGNSLEGQLCPRLLYRTSRDLLTAAKRQFLFRSSPISPEGRQ